MARYSYSGAYTGFRAFREPSRTYEIRVGDMAHGGANESDIATQVQFLIYERL